MRGHFNENPPDLTIRGILGTIRLLAEVAVQQTSESLAVTGLVTSHLSRRRAGRFASYGDGFAFYGETQSFQGFFCCFIPHSSSPKSK